MYLLELQAQGVRGCSATVRAPLKPGYVVLKPPGSALPPLVALASALFYPDGRGGDASLAAEGGKGKAGFTLIGNDQVTYRLVRELGGAGVLQKLNKTTTSFEMVSDSAADIGTYLRATVGLPSKSAFEQIFTCLPSQMPSRRPRAVKGGAAALAQAPVRPSMAHLIPVEPASDIPAARARVVELEKELRLSKEIEQLQFQADGITRQMDELEAQMKGSEGLREALAQAEQDLRSAPDAVALGLPADVAYRAAQYDGAVQRREEALAKLGPETEEPMFAGPSPVEPLLRNQQLWLGVVVGAAFLIGGSFLSGYGRALVLLDIPAFAFAALTALKHVEQLQGASQVSRKGGMRAQREKRIAETFDAEVAVVKDAMRKLGVDSADQVARALEQKPLLEQKVEELRRQLRAFESEPANRQLAAEHGKLKRQADAINQKLTQQGGYIREAREVDTELKRTRESIEKAMSGGGAAASAAGTGLPSPASTAGEHEDPGPSTMRLAADLFQTDVPSLVSLLRDRASQYFTALSDRRYTGLEQEATTGAISAITQGKKIKAAAMPPRDLDLLYLSLRLTLVEKYSTKSKVPLLVEDALGVEESKLSLLSRMLKHLGTLTQVIHVSGNPTFPPVADLSSNL